MCGATGVLRLSDQPQELPQHQAPSLIRAALLGLCPQCGNHTLFNGLAQFAPRCGNCGLDITDFNVGDGPAAFLTLIIGAVVTVIAGWMALSVDPPWWVYVLVLVPLGLGMIIWGLRAGKAALLAVEYKRRAMEAGSSDLRQP